MGSVKTVTQLNRQSNGSMMFSIVDVDRTTEILEWCEEHNINVELISEYNYDYILVFGNENIVAFKLRWL